MTTTGVQSFGLITALTTVFDPPCPISWLLTTTKAPSQYPPFPTAGPASCDPPLWTVNIKQEGFGYYSPAICPIGFTVGCAIPDVRTKEAFPPIQEGETAMYCVPNGHTCTSDTTDFRGGVWGFSATAINGARGAVVGPAIQIRWREGDLGELATDPLTPGLLPLSTVVYNAGSSNVLETSTTVPTILNPIQPTTSDRPIGAQLTTVGNTPQYQTVTHVVPSAVTEISTTTEMMPGIGATPSSKQGDFSNTTSNRQNEPSVASGTSIATMAMSGILIFLILGVLAFMILRRYRRYHFGQIDKFLPVGFKLGRILEWRDKIVPQSKEAAHQTKMPDAELGTDGPIPELGPGNPLGTKENPAELIGNDEQKSFMSRVSKIFTVRLRREVWSV
ncbi:hypothetical protein F5B20DRAFT_574720 [Whalleya microplaca]|nr:hypothetical protein F5B20DRAFT_574720 [Whalleya microplaca]